MTLCWSIHSVSAANSQEISIYFNKYLFGQNKYFLAYFWVKNKYILAEVSFIEGNNKVSVQLENFFRWNPSQTFRNIPWHH